MCEHFGAGVGYRDKGDGVSRRLCLLILGVLGAAAACGTVHPTANELLSDPAAKLQAPGSAVTRTYATNGHKNVTSSDRSSVALAETATSTPEAVSGYYDTALRGLGWARDCRAVLSLSTDGPSTTYGWSKGARQLSLTLFTPATATNHVTFKVAMRVTLVPSAAASGTGPLTPC